MSSLAAIALTAVVAGGIGGYAGYSVAPQAPALPGPVAGTSGSAASAPVLPAIQTSPQAADATVTAAGQVGPAVVSIRTDQGLGSGVIYDSSGLVLTNAHVIEGANTIQVILADGQHLDGRVLGATTGFDIAVVKVNGSNLPTASLGTSSNLQPGQPVVAIGNPYGFERTVTAGVVSAVNRPVNEGQAGSYNQPMIQTDAAINPGNSGGPLIDLQGNVVGINTLMAAPEGMPAQGLGFAVPVDTIKRIAPQLVQDGRVSHSGQPYLGVALSDVIGPSTSTGSGRGIFGNRFPRSTSGADHGAQIQQIDPSGPAGRSGFQAGDVIVKFDGRDVYTSDELLAQLVTHQPGDQVPVTVMRSGRSVDLTLTIGEAPAQ